MNGKTNNFHTRGICARSISQIFNAKKESNSSIIIRVSYIEIYNEQLLDLLTFDETSHNSSKAVGIDSNNSSSKTLKIQVSKSGTITTIT